MRKNIPGYEGLYEATHKGQIYSLPKTWVTYRGGMKKHNGKYLKQTAGSDGYLRVKLRKDGLSGTFLGHRLIAISFIDAIEGKDFVNHKNGAKNDNSVKNLEWVTHKENIHHSFRIGLGNIQTAINCTKIKVIDEKTNEIFDSMTSAAKSVNISRRYLGMMLSGERGNKTNFKVYKN